MANEASILNNPTSVPEAVSTGYQRQNTNIVAARVGMDCWRQLERRRDRWLPRGVRELLPVVRAREPWCAFRLWLSVICNLEVCFYERGESRN